MILQDLNDEHIIETVDFSEFERLFEVRKSKKKEVRLCDESECNKLQKCIAMD